jgi:hypothetical protein
MDRMSEHEEPLAGDMPPPPDLPQVDSPSSEDVLDHEPSVEEIVEQAETVDDIVAHEPTVDDILGKDR